jgi:hypothetical protein
MANAPQRDGTDGTAASASSAIYLQRRQGNLTRASDGFRSPYPDKNPRRPFDGLHTPDSSMTPYGGTPRVPENNVRRYPPRTWAFFRPASIGAPRVNFPDAERCRGKYQRSGVAWGQFGERERLKLTPAVNGRNAPPSHSLGKNLAALIFSIGPRWRRPTSPRIFDHLPH